MSSPAVHTIKMSAAPIHIRELHGSAAKLSWMIASS